MSLGDVALVVFVIGGALGGLCFLVASVWLMAGFMRALVRHWWRKATQRRRRVA